MAAASTVKEHTKNNPTPTTPDLSRKRVLSPTTISPSNEQLNEKKFRKDSIEIDEIEPSQVEMEKDDDLTMSDLKVWMSTILTQLSTTVKVEDLKDLATQGDIQLLNDKITAQNTEIDQVRDDLKRCQEDINKIRSQFDRAVAEELDRKLKTADIDIGQRPAPNVNMAGGFQNNPNRTNTKRRNLIIQGLKGESEDDMIAGIIKITTAIGVIMYKSDIQSITRLTKRDVTNKAPAPVLLTVTRVLLRDMILQKKTDLRVAPGMGSIFINADEPLDIRRNKSILRRVAYNAKNAGKNVDFKHDRVTIDGTEYTLNDLHKIPNEFRPTLRYNGSMENPARDGPRDTQDRPVELMEEGATGGAIGDEQERPKKSLPKQNPTVDQDDISAKRQLFRDNEKIRVTKSGIIFSGPTAFISNMYEAPVKYEGRDYISNEQAIQCTKALVHEFTELAKALKEIDNSYKIKSDAGVIKTTEEWKKSMPSRLLTLFDNKMKENPALLERLMATYPLPLVEASKDSTYGEGGPL